MKLLSASQLPTQS